MSLNLWTTKNDKLTKETMREAKNALKNEQFHKASLKIASPQLLSRAC